MSAEAYEQAESLNPYDVELLLSKGITLDNLGRSDEAMACFERVLVLEPATGRLKRR